ncbi:MAG: sulfatase-like hydrolase/transferase [Acidobacteriota bacterium]
MTLTARKILLFTLVLIVIVPNLNPASETGEKNILLITLDTTRADHLGCYNNSLKFTPNIDKLGSKGIIYENCYSNIPLTLPAHASILTGKHPFEINVRNNGWYSLGSEHKTITESLKTKGYFTFAVISSYVLASKFGLARGFDIYDDSLNVGETAVTQSSQISADKVFNKFKILLNKTGNKKFFGWVHFYDPHSPYLPPGEFRKKFEKDLYLGEVAYTDFYIGKIIKLLEKKKLLNKTIIIVAGDHGEDKGEHGEFSHGIFCYDVTLRVPLIISNGTGLKSGKRVKNRVKLTDIYQAIFELSETSDVKKSSSYLLSSAKGEKGGDRDLYFESLYAKEHMGWSPVTGIISNNYKYISLPEPELFNLNSDPEESSNLFSKKTDIARALDKKLSVFYSNIAGKSSSGKRELSKQDRDHLASLGYISSFKKSNKNIDPKTGVNYLNKLRSIRTAVSEGKLKTAERDLKKIFFSKERIDTIHAYEIFDSLYRKKNDIKNLMKFRELAVKDFPDSQAFTDLLANSYFALGRFDDAERVSRNILKKYKNNTQAILMLGKIQNIKKNFVKALSEFRKAEALEPMNFGIKRNLAFVLRNMGRKSEAVKILEKISGDSQFRSNIDNIGFLSDISLQLLNTGSAEKGLALMKELIALHPDEPQPYISYGTILSKMRRHKESLKYFSEALKRDPENSNAFNKTGISKLMIFMQDRESGLLNEAYDNFTKAISINPEIAESYSGRGTVHIFLRNTPEAIKDLENALKLDPGLLDVYFNLGIVYLRSGSRDKASDLFNKCKKRFYRNMRPAQQKRLDNLIRESN